MNNVNDPLKVPMESRIEVSLHDIACKYQKEYVEVCSLVISELNETVEY